MTEYEQYYELFKTQEIQKSFDDFKTYSSEGARAFKDYYKNTFQELVNFQERTMSTNRVSYTMTYNDEHQYFHIVRAERGCFHGHQDVLTIEAIQHKKEKLEAKIDAYKKEDKDNDWMIGMSNYQLEPLNAILAAYDKVQSKIKIEHELENKSATNKPKI